MSKPLFFTGRKSISRSDVAIHLIERDGQLTKFKASISLSGYGFPRDSSVVVEAYHSAYYERFGVGTVESMQLSLPREMKGLEPGDKPHFRVKVISSSEDRKGRLLGAIDEVRPTSDGDDASGSLLPIVSKTRAQMGDEFWKVHFTSSEEPLPELWINRDVPGLFAALQNKDPRIAGLIMPEVLRQVLRGLVGDGENWTDEGRLGQWLELAYSLHPEKFDESEDDEFDEVARRVRYEWIDNVVARFAAEHRFFERYHEQPAQTEAD